MNKTLWDKSFTIYKQDNEDKIAQHVVEIKDLRKAIDDFMLKIQVPDEYIEGCNGSSIV
jgi:intergrase/recombinase